MPAYNSATGILDYKAVTAAVNEIKVPNGFLVDLFFADHESLESETISVDKWLDDRRMAGFVKKNGEALVVGGVRAQFNELQMPNIRLKMPFVPSNYVFARVPGSGIFESGEQMDAAIEDRMSKDLVKLVNYAQERLEWLASQALTSVISYTDDSGDAFSVDFGRDANFTVTKSGAARWSQTSTADISADIRLVQRQMNLYGHVPTHCILGLNASDYFVNAIRSGSLKDLLDNRRVEIGSAQIDQMEAQGGQFLGRIHGVQFWSYTRSTLDKDGTTVVKFVGDEVAQFVSRTPRAEMKTYFGAIPEVDPGTGRPIRFQGERFAKQWTENDPAGSWQLIHTRPLCTLRRPEATFTMTVHS